MGMIKKGTAVEPTKESGLDAAVSRLVETPQFKDQTTDTEPDTKPQYKPRDFDKEARGKTRCVQFEAALMSPAIAGMKWSTMKEYLTLVKEAADAGVAYSFQDKV